MSSGKVTKKDLIEAVYQETKVEKQMIQSVTDCLFEKIKESLSDGETIELRGFGTFEPRLRQGRENARNPKTGKQLSVGPRYTAVFRLGRELKNLMAKLPVEKNQEDKWQNQTEI